jgi:GT2 family glycosyltransferase
MIDLSIIVLVWQDRSFLPACLESIAATEAGLELEIILVENGIALKATEYAPLRPRIIHNDRNLGVAFARNQGLRAGQGRYLMLLDVDTQVSPDAMRQLISYMDANPGVGLAGPRLQDAQGNLQYTCRKLPTLWTKVLRRVPGDRARAAMADEMLVTYDHRTVRAVDYVIGACQVIRREAYTAVGALDEHYFYGPEDVDYCLRLWRAGWRVMYVPQACVTHSEQRLTQRHTFSKLSLIHSYGLARYFWKHHYLFTRPPLQTITTDWLYTTNQ